MYDINEWRQEWKEYESGSIPLVVRPPIKADKNQFFNCLLSITKGRSKRRLLARLNWKIGIIKRLFRVLRLLMKNKESNEHIRSR